MLLFITTGLAISVKNAAFQYIPCYCLSAPRVQYGKDFLYFNTSHVTVYLNKTHINKLSISISIHPMLLFICIICGEMFEPRTFQYIPCYCLSDLAWRNSMEEGAFQYIPCYCLSKKNTPALTLGENFNTSHVTVYLNSSTNLIKILEFQYIPCYCLSCRNL